MTIPNNISVTQSELKEILDYNPDIGVFYWKRHRANSVKRGKIAGSLKSDGYIGITIYYKLYPAHRLAWLYMTGEDPSHHIDHINRDRSDNRWCNLRKSDYSHNATNRHDNADFIGVTWDKHHRRWKVRTERIDGSCRHIGQYKTHIAACYARHQYNVDNLVVV